MSEELARKFHETYERLAPSFGYETRKETKDFDPTSANGMLMIAVCSEVIGGLSSEIKRLREDNACYVAMKEGVGVRIADLEAEVRDS